MAALARWCFHHRIVVVLAWIAVLVTLVAVQRSVGDAYSTSFTLANTESSKALELVTAALPKQAGDTATIVFHTADGTVSDPATQARIEEMLGKVAAAQSVAAVQSPYGPRGAAQISRDGKTAFATVDFTKLAQDLPPEHIKHVMGLAAAARAPGLEVELGGNAIAEVNRTPPANSEVFGLIAAAIIILIAFGSLFGMALPLVTAITALTSGTFAIALLSHAVSIPSMAPILAALIGLGVGIDYALFIVTRHRDGLKAGASPEDSAVRSLNTSGRAVLFAGGESPAFLLAQHAHAHVAEHRRQQGDRSRHGEGHHEHRRIRHAVEKAHVEHEQAKERDADRAPGEQHGAS